MRNLPFAITAALALPSIACTTAGTAALPSVAMPHVARGKAGPFAAATITITRGADPAAGGFAASLDSGTGRRFALSGPDDPPDFFITEPQAVLFAPVDASHRNAAIILYTSSQIGPGNGTDHKALVYRVTDRGAVRLRDVETRLEGARTAAEVRAHLRKRS